MKKNYIIPAVRITNSQLTTSVIECSGEPPVPETLGTPDVGSKRFDFGEEDSDDNFWSTK